MAANDAPNASVTLMPRCGPIDIFRVRRAGYRVGSSGNGYRHAAGSANFEKRPRHKRQYGHGARPGGGPSVA